MCFKTPKAAPPPPLPPPDPELQQAKAAQFQVNADKLASEKDSRTDMARAKAYGFYGTRSLLGSSDGGLLNGGR